MYLETGQNCCFFFPHRILWFYFEKASQLDLSHCVDDDASPVLNWTQLRRRSTLIGPDV